MASLARCSRLGATSLASMLREQSRMKSVSWPNRWLTSACSPHCGPRQGNPDPGGGEDEQRLLEGAPGGADGAGQFFDEVRRGNLGELFPPRPGGIALQRDQHAAAPARPARASAVRRNGGWRSSWQAKGMTETRSPKPETRRKAEYRNPKAETGGGARGQKRTTGLGLRPSDFGLRISAFLRVSVFGIRVSHHGTLLNRVFAKPISKANRPNAASNGHWYNGR